MDVVGLKLGFGIFALAWAVIMMLHAAASSWQILAVLRGLMGFAEGTAQPGGMKAVAEWFPAKERGFAGGFYNIGASFGSMLAAPLVAWSIMFHSWRLAFIIAGAAALIWVAMWFRFYHSPKDHPRLTKEERDHIESGQESHLAATATKPSLLSLLKQRNTWGIAIPRMLADPTWGTLSFWVPFYLMNERGFDLKQIAWFAWMPFLTADLGCLAGPSIAMWLQKRGVGLINARRWAFTVGAVLMVGIAFVAKVDSAYVAIALLCLGGFAHQTLSITVITMSSDLFRKNEVATVAGIAGFCGNFGVLIFTLLIGGLVKVVGYDPFFVALAVFDILAAIWLWSVVRERVVPPAGAAA
jgi:ACS family hexuronate transporter-like MFS transporter